MSVESLLLIQLQRPARRVAFGETVQCREIGKACSSESSCERRRSNMSREYTPLQLQMLLRTHTDLLVIWAIDYPTILFGNQHFWLLTWYVTLKFLTDQEFKQATHNWELRLESKLHIQLHFFLSFLSMGNVTNIDVLFPLVGWLIEGFVYPLNNR